MGMLLMTALGSALVLATVTETAIAANYRDATETFYAAEAAVDRAVHDLASMANWDTSVTPEAFAVSPTMQVSIRVTRGPAEGALTVVGEARGRGGSRRTIEVTLMRETGSGESPPGRARVVMWRELS